VPVKHFPLIISLALLLLAGCGAEATAVPPAPTPETDSATGLPLNPVAIPAGEFIVEGEISAVNLIPQDAPLFKITTPNGAIFQINAQPVSDISMADGRPLHPIDIRNGMQVRATVFQGEAGGLGGEPVLSSRDLTIVAAATPGG